MTKAFDVGERVSVRIVLPGIPLGTLGSIVAIVFSQPPMYLVQCDDQTILPFIASATMLVRLPSAA